MTEKIKGKDLVIPTKNITHCHCGKIIRIRSYSDANFPAFPAVRIRKNTDQNNSEYGYYLRRVSLNKSK